MVESALLKEYIVDVLEIQMNKKDGYRFAKGATQFLAAQICSDPTVPAISASQAHLIVDGLLDEIYSLGKSTVRGPRAIPVDILQIERWQRGEAKHGKILDLTPAHLIEVSRIAALRRESIQANSALGTAKRLLSAIKPRI